MRQNQENIDSSSFLRELMNCGFIIFKDNTKFVLKKIPTPTDPRESLTDAIQPDTSKIVFDEYVEALRVAKTHLSFEKCVSHRHDKEVVVEDNDASAIWNVQMRYNHKGLGIKFEDLGFLPATTYPEAIRLANQRAKEFADLDEMVEEWEVRVLPHEA